MLTDLRHLGLATLLLTGCGETVTIDNAPPKVTLTGLCEANDRAYIVAEVIDHERTDLNLRLTTAEGTIAPGPTGAGLLGLRSERGPEPVRHLIEWAAGVETIEGQGEVDPCEAIEALDLPGPKSGCALFTAGGETATVRIYAFDEEEHDLGEQTLSRLDACP